MVLLSILLVYKFQFREEIFMRSKHVIVEDYNLEWKNEFKRIKMNYL